MNNYFLTLLNHTFFSTQDSQDKIFKCNQDIYSDIKANIVDCIRDRADLYRFIEKSCSITKFLGIVTNIFPKTIIFQSNINKPFNVIIQHNSTSFTYEHMSLYDKEDLMYSYNESYSWSKWISERFYEIFRKICTYRPDSCIRKHDLRISEDFEDVFKEITDVLHHTYNDSITDNIEDQYNSTSTTYNDFSSNNTSYNYYMIFFLAGMSLGSTIVYCLNKIYCTQHYYNTDNSIDNDIELQSVADQVQGLQVQVVTTPKEAVRMMMIEEKNKLINSYSVSLDSSFSDSEHVYETFSDSEHVHEIYENIPYNAECLGSNIESEI